jgi:hypothetical protein
MTGELGDMQRATMLQVFELEQKRREYIMRIKSLDGLNNEQTDPLVEGLTLMQLMSLDEMKRKELNKQMNGWFYNQAITAGGGFLGKMANGKTGNRVIDRYLNMSRLGPNLTKMKSQTWWKLALEEITGDSVLGGRPGWALLAMLGMTGCITVQEGIDEYDAMEALRKQELERVRLHQLEMASQKAIENGPSPNRDRERGRDRERDPSDDYRTESSNRPRSKHVTTQSSSPRSQSQHPGLNCGDGRSTLPRTKPGREAERMKKLARHHRRECESANSPEDRPLEAHSPQSPRSPRPRPTRRSETY